MLCIIPDAFKNLLARLQIPYIKVALIDPNFLARKQHPARRLLSALTQAGIGRVPESQTDGTSDLLLSRVEIAVNRVINEFEDDSHVLQDIFDDFRISFDQEVSQAERQEAAVLDQERKVEAHEIANIVADAAIEQILAGYKVPEEIIRFLRYEWRDLLAAIYGHSGTDSEVWKRALNIASTLVWSLTLKPTAKLREQLLATLPGLLRALNSGMEKTHVPDEFRMTLFTFLAGEHAHLARVDQSSVQFSDFPVTRSNPESSPEAAQPSSDSNDSGMEDQRNFMARKTEEIRCMIAAGRFRGRSNPVPENAGEGAGEIKVQDGHQTIAETMKEGTWLDWQDSGGAQKRVKLSWRSIISEKCFFADRHGLKVTEMTPQVLAAELRKGRMQIIEETERVDKALLAALNTLIAEVG